MRTRYDHRGAIRAPDAPPTRRQHLGRKHSLRREIFRDHLELQISDPALFDVVVRTPHVLTLTQALALLGLLDTSHLGEGVGEIGVGKDAIALIATLTDRLRPARIGVIPATAQFTRAGRDHQRRTTVAGTRLGVEHLSRQAQDKMELGTRDETSTYIDAGRGTGCILRGSIVVRKAGQRCPHLQHRWTRRRNPRLRRLSMTRYCCE